MFAGAAVKPLADRDRLFKLEDVSVGSWVEWVEQESGQATNRVGDRRWVALQHVAPCLV